MNNLTVAYVVPGWPLSSYPNGIVTYANNLLQGFNHTTNAYILAHKTDKLTTGSNIVDLSKINLETNIANRLYNLLIFKIANSFTYKLRYEHVYSSLSKTIYLGIKKLPEHPDLIELEESFGVGKWLTQLTHTPIITRLHGPRFVQESILDLLHTSDYRPRILNEGLGILTSNGITAPSKSVLTNVREYYEIDLPNAVVIPNPVPEVPPALRWRGISSATKSILFVGRFDLLKGGDLVLEAFRIIALKNPDIKLIFVGPDGSVTKDKKSFNFSGYVNEYIPENHIKERIEFKGHMNAEQIAFLRQNSLVTVVASRYETFCISLVEALAAGCPVVAANTGAIKEIVTDHYNGLLAEPESAESIAQNVLILLNNIPLMRQLSENAINDCAKKYKPELVAKQTLDYYHSVLDRTKK